MRPHQVHGLWIGSELGPMQLLTIRSFQHHGFIFNLWTYDPNIGNGTDAVIRNANDIIPEQRVFRYRDNGCIDVPFGRGSCAGFSDMFRYRLLYEHGGWYTDLDVTCLREPDFDTDYVFRDHWLLPAVGNIMRCPPKSEVMRLSYELCSKAVTEENDDWHKPVRILCRFIKQQNLSHFVRRGICNLDDSLEITTRFLQADEQIPPEWYFLHWCNAINGCQHSENSTYAKLLKHYL
jgi:hypothetical protein